MVTSPLLFQLNHLRNEHNTHDPQWGSNTKESFSFSKSSNLINNDGSNKRQGNHSNPRKHFYNPWNVPFRLNYFHRILDRYRVNAYKRIYRAYIFVSIPIAIFNDTNSIALLRFLNVYGILDVCGVIAFNILGFILGRSGDIDIHRATARCHYCYKEYYQ